MEMLSELPSMVYLPPALLQSAWIFSDPSGRNSTVYFSGSAGTLVVSFIYWISARFQVLPTSGLA